LKDDTSGCVADQSCCKQSDGVQNDADVDTEAQWTITEVTMKRTKDDKTLEENWTFSKVKAATTTAVKADGVTPLAIADF